jgi:hypothetical protein
MSNCLNHHGQFVIFYLGIFAMGPAKDLTGLTLSESKNGCSSNKFLHLRLHILGEI